MVMLQSFPKSHSEKLEDLRGGTISGTRFLLYAYVFGCLQVSQPKHERVCRCVSM